MRNSFVSTKEIICSPKELKMKKKVSSTNHLRSPSWLHVLILLTLIGTSVSVEGQRVCNTTDYNNIQNASDPNIAHRRQQIENFTQNYVQTANHTQARDIVTIPCVVHVIYNTSAENISDAQIQSQMDVINEDFRLSLIHI